MIDCYRASENRLDDIRTVHSVLNEIVGKLNLESVMPPFLCPYYYAKESEDDGISAFVILNGGHITIHTFPKRGCLFLDLLYDGYFDEFKLCSVLRRAFNYLPEDEKTLRTERRIFDVTIDEADLWNGNPLSKDFGPHIIARIEDVKVEFEKIFDMLDELPQSINMIPICRPYVLKTHSFISGLVLIAQSHIAFHYDIAERTLFCDMFSCSFYKSSNFVDYLRKYFGDLQMHEMTLIRGSKHDKQIVNREYKVKLLGSWQKKH